MEIKFWGTRGSIPAPGPHTLEFGGNTSCVEVLLNCGRRLVIDGGTGLRLLGKHLMEEASPISIHLLLSPGLVHLVQATPENGLEGVRRRLLQGKADDI